MSSLEEMIATLRRLPTIGERAAKIAAPLIEQAARKQASAGTDPGGHAWQLKKDGGRALVHAADRVHAVAVGDRVDLSVDGPEFWHQTAKEGGARPQRKIIPSVGDPLPPHLKAAADQATAQAFAELTRTR